MKDDRRKGSRQRPEDGPRDGWLDALAREGARAEREAWERLPTSEAVLARASEEDVAEPGTVAARRVRVRRVLQPVIWVEWIGVVLAAVVVGLAIRYGARSALDGVAVDPSSALDPAVLDPVNAILLVAGVVVAAALGFGLANLNPIGR